MIAAMLDFLTFALCAPYSETTDGTQFDMLLEMVAENGRVVFKLFQVRHGFHSSEGCNFVFPAVISLKFTYLC